MFYKLCQGIIPNFNTNELKSNPVSIKSRVVDTFAKQLLIVRSSAVSEDSALESLAGKFLSVVNVKPEDVLGAALQVMGSFGDGNGENQILVQPMLTDISMSGVLFTIDPNTGGNYFVINYDSATGSTDSVTSGEGKNLSVCYIFRGKKTGDDRLDRLCEGAKELMGLFGRNNIDIEFAFTHSGELYLLQARPLVLKQNAADYEAQCASLARTHRYITQSMQAHPYARGRRSIYGIMPDWNPAEMIGIRPRPLASSLYRRLITDGTWAYQRDEYGYRNLRSFPLMLEFCGLPYIDIRVSFNSFVPKDIDDSLSDKLVNYYLDCLERDPDKHDKVEFEIVFSCNTFDLHQQIKALSAHGFTQSEQNRLQDSLRALTNNIINAENGLWITDTGKIDILDKRRETIANSDMDDVAKIYWLLADCTRYGTLPFAGLARAGFVAVQLLKSLVSIGILSDGDYQNYMESLNTVSSQMSIDWRNLSRSAFLRRYGHLRPGTYDILSKRYDAAPELYLGSHQSSLPEREKNPFSLSLDQYSAIQQKMTTQGLNGDVLSLFKFLKAGIEGREYSKFIFTKSLSLVLELFAKLGASYGISKEDMSYLDCFIIDRLYSSATDIKSVLLNSIEEGKRRYVEALTVTMPPVILSPDDIYSFHMPSGSPNFITLKEVSGEVCADNLSRDSITGKILLVHAADPGYDWIFSCEILGFVTAYGGANSHMAIRAGELGIPAVIGVGEKEFNRLSHAKMLHINCANRKIEVIH